MSAQFNAASTADEVLSGIDLTGKRYLITGVSSGMGVETARALAAHGAEVVGTARDLRKAEQATGGGFEVIELDLADLQSIRAAADKLLSDRRSFDGVVANAGVMATPFGKTKDGFEIQFGTNHLGHFLLVNRIAPLILDGGRLVTVSSNSHRWADINLEDPNFEQAPYDPWIAYGAAKTANVLFAVEFDRRHRGRGVRACSLMPGISMTGLAAHLSQEELGALGQRVASELGTAGETFAFKTLPQVAATSVWAAAVAKAEEIGGKYCQDCGVAPVDNAPGLRFGVMPHALDADRARRLWAKSEELLGEAF